MTDELKSVKNVALVYVTATVPPGERSRETTARLHLSASSARAWTAAT